MKIKKTSEYIVYAADNLAALKRIRSDFVDAVVTDPPYGLSSEPDIAKMLAGWTTDGYYTHSSTRGFMGKEWDAFVPQPVLWKEVFRVLKPGGHAVVFFGTRTYDIGVLALRMAGFEIRDSLSWIYGQGMPKNLDVSKAITAKETVGNCHSSSLRKARMRDDYRPTGQKDWKKGHAFNTPTNYADGNTLTELTHNAKAWQGWGTSLKPAQELIVLVRKPFDGTVAANVLKRGTGAINIDACRVSYASDADMQEGINKQPTSGGFRRDPNKVGVYGEGKGVPYSVESKGRWPSNVILTHHAECRHIGSTKIKAQVVQVRKTRTNGVLAFGYKQDLGHPGFGDASGYETQEKWVCHEDCPIRILDEQSGDRSSSRIGNVNNPKRGGSTQVAWGLSDGRETNDYRDSGSASRFFYCSKASKTERQVGLGKTQNEHPTVKPVDLMRYLVKLITPVKGVVLDPFMGSGTTGVAAMKEKRKFIGMEQTEESARVALKRIRHAIPPKGLF
jgi:site-specific DNA-methyltransferase (adenine-specific)